MNKGIIVTITILMAYTFSPFVVNVEGQNENKTEILKKTETDSTLLFLPENGCVPNTETATKIAEAIWLPVYGESILKQKPFKAQLNNDSIWVVHGSLPDNYNLGGVAYIEIAKRDGRVIGITHGK